MITAGIIRSGKRFHHLKRFPLYLRQRILVQGRHRSKTSSSRAGQADGDMFSAN